MTKKLISIITSIIMCIGCFSISVSAKVIEPEIVKTESWTTSYYIDDDMDTLYPYIQCEADIYNDGTIKLYMWNTHEWDGFATVRHKVKLISMFKPIQENSKIYCLRYYNKYTDEYGNDVFPISEKTYHDNTFGAFISNSSAEPFEIDNKILSSIDFSYYSEKYEMYMDNFYFPFPRYRGTDDFNYYYQSYNGAWYPHFDHIHEYVADVALCELDYSDLRPENSLCATFNPKVDPTGTYNFRLFGHDITITPELLSGNIISEPELTEQEKYIKQLEEENARLKASITNTNLFGDINGDSLVDVADAQMILNYYVYTLANSNAEPLEEWISKQ